MQPDSKNCHLRNENTYSILMNNILRIAIFAFLGAFLHVSHVSSAQGVGFPSHDWGIGFGNTTNFSGLRFNGVDQNIEKI